eukprot:915593-Amphidinium_carterae.1
MYSGSRRILIQGASAGRQAEVRKYVDDMVLVACGPYFAYYLRDNYRDLIKALRQANMQVDPKKTVIICNGTHTKNKLKKAWRAGLLPPWASWRNRVQRKRIRTFEQSTNRVRGLGVPAHVKARIAKSLHSVGLYGAEVGGIPKSGMTILRTSARKLWRKALGKGAGLRRSATLELMAHGGLAADPQVSAELWDDALKPGRGRGPVRNVKQLAVRLG